MANTPRDTEAAQDLGRCLSAHRTAAGNPSYGHISRWIYKHLDREISDNQIALLHAGKIDPNHVHVENLLALCRFYEVAPIELGEVAAERMANVLVLADFDRSAGDDDPEKDDRGQGNDASGCRRGIPAQYAEAS